MSKSIGFVYVLSNKSTPGLVKIGYTLGAVELRANELFTTGVPSKFDIEFKIKVTNPRKWEGLIHKHFHDLRLERREWFKTTPEEAISICKKIIGDLPVQDANIFEQEDSLEILKEVSANSYEMYITRERYLRKQFFDFVRIFVDVYFSLASEAAIKNSSFFQVTKNSKKITLEKYSAVASLGQLNFINLPTEKEFLEGLIDECAGNIKRTRQVAQFLNSIKISDFLIYPKDHYYNQNVCLVYDEKSERAKRDFSANIERMKISIEAARIVNQINHDSIKNNLIKEILSLIKSGGSVTLSSESLVKRLIG
jgi:hypothetical protein